MQRAMVFAMVLFVVCLGAVASAQSTTRKQATPKKDGPQSQPKAGAGTAGRPTTQGRGSTSRPTTSSRPTSAPAASTLPDAGVADFGPFRMAPPKGWKTKVAPIAAGLRKAVYVYPKVEGDSEDAELVVFLFRGDGGSVEANLARWRSQMKKPENLSDDEHCQFSKQTVGDLPVTIAEIRGDYRFDPRNPNRIKPGQMMLSAIVETDSGNYFIRTTGPEKTMQSLRKDWYQMMLSLKTEAKK